MRDQRHLRPGVKLGHYPQRPPNGDNRFERALAGAVRGIRPPPAARRRAWRAFLRLVNSHTETLADAGKNRLADHIENAKRHLHNNGLTQAAIARVFAIVREVAEREVGMRHFDVQLIGGWVMMEGMLAEMRTGEGKTLAATLPACTAALSGIPVHVVSVNDYLVTRDAEEMGPIYSALGLTVGVITEDMDPDARRKAYACDITYCSNKQLVFDYLKDKLALGSGDPGLKLKLESLHSDQPRVDRLLLRGLYYAIVDEADSVLIDEARTPLILSAQSQSEEQVKVCRQALFLAGQLREGTDFILHPRERQLELLDRAEKRLTEIAEPLGGLWTGERRRRELVTQALTAKHLFLRDKQYLVRDDKIQIIDEHTGRVMADRAWERGLHQMIETKENVELTSNRETLARISYQRFFRRYLRLGGMSGTLEEVRGELWSVYGLGVVTVPTNRPMIRSERADLTYRRAVQKWTAIVKRIRAVHKRGRPILVGTRSVEDSEHLSRLLKRVKLEHQVLNAHQDEQEAEIVACAGEKGRITVATNMAGRGTDIKLGPGVKELGGLHVISSERNIARRIDRQLA
ncbi:MAG: prepilin peptidase, partial [Gammaproteobacteria bacterium]|nr:prepilin peptidase [Gammaproteobacteria bacterium]NIO66147.1 prepilin peptidase [Gammaproteobacteria bacterium]NIP45015.1 prepilin peptidase [Gammaproteobacteria bacterium]NIP65121.1 prepilin peptidase [Gammaproteobacteria bacterium]NIP87545.1 prepilin peptidase [Gammaproteobacteria bacterium]